MYGGTKWAASIELPFAGDGSVPVEVCELPKVDMVKLAPSQELSKISAVQRRLEAVKSCGALVKEIARLDEKLAITAALKAKLQLRLASAQDTYGIEDDETQQPTFGIGDLVF